MILMSLEIQSFTSKGHCYTELVARFMKEKFITAACCNKCSIEFVLNFPSTELEILCDWTRNLLGVGQRSSKFVFV